MRHLLVVKRDQFKLEVWKWRSLPPREYRLVETFPIAVGAKGYATPAGIYRVIGKDRTPQWTMPDSDWVEPELRGTTLPSGHPANPIVGAWLGLTDDGVGIHGTNNVASLGSKASHGCIRVRPSVAIHLHRKVKKGTPVVVI